MKARWPTAWSAESPPRPPKPLVGPKPPPEGWVECFDPEEMSWLIGEDVMVLALYNKTWRGASGFYWPSDFARALVEGRRFAVRPGRKA